MWLRSWWTHSPRSSSTRNGPTAGCIPTRPRSAGPRPDKPTPSARSASNSAASSAPAAGGRAEPRRQPAGPSPRVGRRCRAVRSQDPADPAGEATTLGFDHVADALVGAPLPRLGSPAAVAAEGDQFGDDGRDGRLKEVGDSCRRERGRVGHGALSLSCRVADLGPLGGDAARRRAKRLTATTVIASTDPPIEDHRQDIGERHPADHQLLLSHPVSRRLE